MRSIRNVSVKDRSVLLRVDFNVSIRNGKVLDDFRIRKVIRTIQWLLEHGSRIFIISHLGRPRGRDAALSLRPVAEHLERLLERRVIFFDEPSEDLGTFWRTLQPGIVGMLENLRFWAGEEKNDARFAKILASLGDMYVNDAFGVLHRRNASIVAVTKFLPSYAGLLVEEELAALDRVRRASRRPFVAVFGGAKLSDKLPLISAFVRKAECILTGGGVANTFLAAKGIGIGKSLAEAAYVDRAKIFLRSGKIVAPCDWKVATSPTARRSRTSDLSLARDEAIFDIGPKTAAHYASSLRRARMILWNGPMGYFENARFAKGSYAVARAIANNRKAFSVVGGGETISCFRRAIPNYQFLISKNRLFLSTGGGVMLEYLAGKKLPGIEALKRR